MLDDWIIEVLSNLFFSLLFLFLAFSIGYCMLVFSQNIKVVSSGAEKSENQTENLFASVDLREQFYDLLDQRFADHDSIISLCEKFHD